jgi:hypothetical protein
MYPLNIHSYTAMTPENTEAQTKLYKALVNFIAETTDIQADDYNPHFRSKFASLSMHLKVLKPIAKKHGLAIVQMPIGDEYGVGVRTTIVHTDGGVMSADAIVPSERGMQGQHAGAIYSYLRRYALASVCGCATDDDDAETDRQIKTTSKPSASPATAQPVKKAVSTQSAPASGSNASFVVPFGDAKGVALSELPLRSTDKSKKCADLNYWANVWEPRPFGDSGKISAKDLATKAEAQRLWSSANGPQEDAPSDEVPF